jgi:hypothetical protein
MTQLISLNKKDTPMSLQLTIQIGTLISVVVGFIGLINTVRSYHEQMNVQILMKYTERYEHILERFPQEALAARFDAKVVPTASPELTLCVLKYLNLCSEEFYLLRHGYLSKSLWRIWEGDLRRMLASPLLRREWGSLRAEFISHRDFLDYVERIQSDSETAGVAHA